MFKKSPLAHNDYEVILMSDEEFFTLIELLGVDEACDLLLETTISDIFIEHLLEQL